MTRSGLALLVLAIIAIGFAVAVQMEPPRMPDPLISRPVPDFDLESPLPDSDGLKTADVSMGGITIVNIFGSWCPPCEVEHPQLMRLAMRGVPIYGIDYKDEDADVQEFLTRLGNPFSRIGRDPMGDTGTQFGVRGVPQTFIINGAGTIVYDYLGPIEPRDLNDIILPVIRRAALNQAAKQ